MTTTPQDPGGNRLTAEQLDTVSGGGLYGTEYWIEGEIGGRAWVYDGSGNCVGVFADAEAAHRWILATAGLLDPTGLFDPSGLGI